MDEWTNEYLGSGWINKYIEVNEWINEYIEVDEWINEYLGSGWTTI